MSTQTSIQPTDTPPNTDTRYHAGAYRSSGYLRSTLDGSTPNSPLALGYFAVIQILAVNAVA